MLLAKSKRTAHSNDMRAAAELSVLAADWILRAKDGKGLSTDAILMAASAQRKVKQTAGLMASKDTFCGASLEEQGVSEPGCRKHKE